MKACPYCAEEIQDAAIVCRFCQRPLTTGGVAVVAPTTAAPTRSPGVAAVLSFFIPGLGQLYKGQIGKGLAFLVFTIIGYAALIVPGLILHLAAILEAYNGGAPSAPPRQPSPEQLERVRVYEAKTPEERRAETRQTFYLAGSIIAGLVVLGILVTWLSPQPSRPNETVSGVRGGTVTVGESAAMPETTDAATALIRRFGQPDMDNSTEHDTPRPPIVTRTLTYRRARVRAAYRADLSFGSREPVAGRWKLVGFTDPATNSPLAADVALKRLDQSHRQRAPR